MEYNKWKLDDIKDLASDLGINLKNKKYTKSELIIYINDYVLNYKHKKKSPKSSPKKTKPRSPVSRKQYKKISLLGNKGKEGITYLVENTAGEKYAMKTFNSRKSILNIEKEGKLQKIAADAGISPKVVKIDTKSKCIVMEKMDNHLYDVMKTQNGNLTQQQQISIVNIFKKLDEIGVFHADSNLMNYMYKNNKLYIIDFGMSKKIDDKLVKKLNTKTPNMKYMLLGFILKLKELKCPESSYKYLANYMI